MMLIASKCYLVELPSGGKRSRLCRGDRFNFCGLSYHAPDKLGDNWGVNLRYDKLSQGLKMPKIEITISEDLKLLIEELAKETDQSMSSMAADCLKTGAYAEVESRNKVEIFRKLRRQRKNDEG
ncbi:hypothetical protein [Nostoc sp. JL23]|uniref:hypothetical protein n=1 Tax=Nostoc sp. JL23 TaxID=2815394 RepID=UPI001D602974|nr:hypothetical protein [Nostoc sp. JL23]MBN3875180.1 hypothetical protein [Nostoc sp. JL23]